MIYDIAIIGAGPAGYLAAERAGQAGLKTVLFDKRFLGGVCLNEGCIPTKTLLYTAKLYENILHGSKYGIVADNVKYDFPAIVKRKNKVVKKLVGGIQITLKKSGVEWVDKEAVIQGKNQDQILIRAGDKAYETRNLLIATGSEAAIPPIPGLDKISYMTNREILELNEIPDELTILGGGVIGIEFASFFASMGTRVQVVELMPEILPEMDKDISNFMREELSTKSVEFILGEVVQKMEGKNLVTENKKIPFRNLLVSVGRTPAVSTLGLDKLNIELSGKGIKIDNHCRTNIHNVYAAGDVTGFSLLAHTAYREAEVAINTILGKKDIMRYDAVPAVVYTNPEIASVGLTEKMAEEKGIQYEVRKLPMAYSGRFVAENEGKTGFAKMLVGEKYKEILGVHIVGNPASEMIYGAGMMIENEMRLKDVEELIFPHPTVSEIIRELIFDFKV